MRDRKTVHCMAAVANSTKQNKGSNHMPIAELRPLPRISRNLDGDTCHAEDGCVEPAIGFDYDTIYGRDEVFHVEQQTPTFEELSPEALDAARKLIVRVMEWIWAEGTKNVDGLQNRAAIACWKFIPHLRPLTMVQLASGFGKHKQSLGRAADSFALAFPELSNRK